MKATLSSEYRELERESSDLLMEWDARWVLGRYEEAASAALRAGLLRRRMGNLCAEAGDASQAAADWLSAADASLQATNTELASLALDQVLAIHDRGDLPPERVDLHKALREREKGLAHLKEAVRSLGTTFRARGWQFDVPDPAALEYLLQQVRELPGLGMLHYTIARQAAGLGQQQLADAHLVWATAFDPHNESVFAQLVFSMIRSGRAKEAQKLAEEFLSHHQEAVWVRVLFAIALASDSEAAPASLERAAELLEPLTVTPSDTLLRAGALAVSVEVLRALGQSEKAARLFAELAELEQREVEAEVKSALVELRATVSLSPTRPVLGDQTELRNGSPSPDLLHLACLLMPLSA